MMAGAATSQRTAAVPAMAPSAARLSLSGLIVKGGSQNNLWVDGAAALGPQVSAHA